MTKNLQVILLSLITLGIFGTAIFIRGNLVKPSSDFVNLFVGTKTLESGEEQLYNVKIQREQYELLATDEIFVPYKETPLKAALLYPLQNLSLKASSETWFLINLVIILISGVFVSQKEIKNTLMFFVLGIGFYPILDNLRIGHVGMPLLLILSLFYYYKTRNKPGIAGFTSGLLIIQPNFLTLIPFFAMLLKGKEDAKKYLGGLSLSLIIFTFLNFMIYGSRNLISDYFSFIEGLRSQEFSSQTIPEFSFISVIRQYLGASGTQAYFYNGIAIAAAIIFLSLLKAHWDNENKTRLIIISSALIFSIQTPIYALTMLFPFLFTYLQDMWKNGKMVGVYYGMGLYIAPAVALPLLGKVGFSGNLLNLIILAIPIYLITNYEEKKNAERLPIEKTTSTSDIFR